MKGVRWTGAAASARVRVGLRITELNSPIHGRTSKNISYDTYVAGNVGDDEDAHASTEVVNASGDGDADKSDLRR